ncbi:MAG: hypothetical protein KKF39_03030, partial [Nanoarchaeota archaeon]|nr:hypothetical protein [Nanoarchaeota archaeon]
MKSEYIRLSPPEKDYGKKHLLSSQLELLNLIQSFQKYRSLRNEELVLKVALKNKTEETLTWIDKLERILPKAHYKVPVGLAGEKERKKRERKLSLQEEIDKIRAKLGKLNRG